MKIWIFKLFGEKRSDVDDWIEGLSPKARARMDSIIEYMEVTKDWTSTKYFSPLTGYDGINEIKFTVQSIQYRPLGCYGPGEKEFTILIGAREKGDRFNPIRAPQIAIKRRKEILGKKGNTHDF